MINTLNKTLVRHKRIIPVLVAVAAIAAYMIPANSLAFAAISQSISQTNANVASNSGKYGGAFADNNLQVNNAQNSAFVKIGSVGGPTNGAPGVTRGVAQSIDQTNLNLASNTGDFGTASASHNTQINIASNHAKVVKASGYVGNSGGGVVSTGHVNQKITQQNVNSADNSGSSGSASASNNVQINSAHNTAHVSISHISDSIKHPNNDKKH